MKRYLLYALIPLGLLLLAGWSFQPDDVLFGGNVWFDSGTVTVDSDTTLDVDGPASFAGANTLSGATTLSGALTASSTADFSSTVEIQDTPVVVNQRFRKTIGEINAGATLLPAVAGRQWRLVDCIGIAYGGNIGAVTTIDVKGTQTSAVKLVAFAQANLTQSAVLRAGGTGAAVLADGASFVACDANSAITLAITGSNATTATGVDFILTAVLE